MREWEIVCQKPQWREVGSLLARRFARPLALYLTRAVVRWPVSANAVTAISLGVGLLAAGLLAFGSRWAWVSGAFVLHLWYLLDHVDGQVARFRRSESVTGTYLDFMMHHVVHLACPFCWAYGMAWRSGELAWTLAGAACAIGMATLSLSNDCRYKAYFAALFAARRSEPGVARNSDNRPPLGMRPQAPGQKGLPADVGETGSHRPSAAGRIRHMIYVGARSLCEMPNVILAVSGLACLWLVMPTVGFPLVRGYVLLMALLAPALGIAHVTKQVWKRLPDVEFRTLTEPVSSPTLLSKSTDRSWHGHAD